MPGQDSPGCIKSLIEDYKTAGGVCSGTSNYGGYPVSDIPCVVSYGSITQGLCSSATVELLMEEDCRNYIFNNKQEVYYTIDGGLIYSMCTIDTWVAFLPSSGDNKKIAPKPPLSHRDNNRLNPITFVGSSYGGYAFGPIRDLVNTKNRYSWICSLRTKSEDKRHLCGVTLLSMPPSPTILVSAAHCVTVCRSRSLDKMVPNCCCPNVGDENCSNNTNCGGDPEVVNMTEEDGEIICGEWETGPSRYTESGEDYNIILPINNITRHPNYTISRGEGKSQFVANDLAVFFVDDTLLKDSDVITPICLPSSSKQQSTTAFHSGWSSPPSKTFLQQYLPAYVPYHRQFFYQWHHKLNIVECEDPKGTESYKFPSNSSYPPGVICAIDKWAEFCPSSGESGSPLMYKHNEKYVMAGISSFSKGCSEFSYRNSSLTQNSVNPLVYVKLSCYLPWIADQYNMTYEADDADCDTSTGGDINDTTTVVCTAFPTSSYPVEAECLLPYTLDGTQRTGCSVYTIKELTHPVFKCPIRSIKNRNTTYFTNSPYNTTDEFGNNVQVNEVFNAVYCPTNSVGSDVNSGVISYIFNSDGPRFGSNGEYELDPDNDQCRYDGNVYGLPVFGSCKNDCRGGNI